MAKLREIRQTGSSMVLTIPKDTGFLAGDWVRFEKIGNDVLLVKVMNKDAVLE